MKILLSTNFAPSEVMEKNGIIFVNEGWVTGLKNAILRNDGNELVILYPCTNNRGVVVDTISDNYICYGYSLKDELDQKQYILAKMQIESIIRETEPDVIHLMGSEYPHSLLIYSVCEMLGIQNRVVLSIQGLISKCAEIYSFGVPKYVKLGLTICDVYKKESIRHREREFFERGIYEIKLIEKVSNIIGRTDWDKRICKSINPIINYYYNGEILRDCFYTNEEWKLDNCKRKLIFIPQASYPLKGFHIFLEALAEVVKKIPDAKVIVGGLSPCHSNPIKRNSYGYYISSLLKKKNLENYVTFVGRMSAEMMKHCYLQANVVVISSVLENSSNAIGEAMILGVPVVASNVGGTDSIIDDSVNGLLYPITEPYTMATQIIEILNDGSLANQLSRNALKKGYKLHNPQKNISELLEIYNCLGIES